MLAYGRALSPAPGCRAVELSRLRRGAVEPVVEVLPVEPVEPVEADSMCRCVELSRTVEKLSSCRAVERVELLSTAVERVELLNSCLAVEPGNAYAYTQYHIALHEAL